MKIEIMILFFILAVLICEAQAFPIIRHCSQWSSAVPGATVSIQNINHSTITDEKGIFTFH